MKIVQIINSSETGGVQVLADSIERGLIQKSFDVETVYLFDGPGAKLQKLITSVFRIRKINPDVIITYQGASCISAAVLKLISSFKIKTIAHQTCLPTETGFLVRFADRILGSLGFYDLNIANTKSTENAFRTYPASYRRRLHLLEHGLVEPQALASREAVRLQYGIPQSACMILNVGRLTPQKNQQVLIEGFPLLAEDICLAIAGEGPDHEALSKKAAASGLAKKVLLLGNVAPSEIGSLLAAADIFVFPSTWETFGLAGVEAAMCGLPIVAADLPVLREVLAPAGGVKFVGGGAEEWRLALTGVVSELSHYKAKAVEGAARMRETYGLNTMTQKYAKMISGL